MTEMIHVMCDGCFFLMIISAPTLANLATNQPIYIYMYHVNPIRS